jgi:cell division protein FtsX
MLRISLVYISVVIILSFFFSFMTLNYPNYFSQFNDQEKIEIVLKNMATHSTKWEKNLNSGMQPSID